MNQNQPHITAANDWLTQNVIELHQVMSEAQHVDTGNFLSLPFDILICATFILFIATVWNFLRSF
jgi:hypothetical protein